MAVACATTNLEASLKITVSDLFQGLLSERVSYMPKYTPRYGKMPSTETPNPL